MSDRRSLATRDAERHLVGLGRAEAAGITALILLVAGFVAGLPGGFLLGWLVFG